MTIKQYQKLATAIAKLIKDNGGDVDKVRHLKFDGTFAIDARNPRAYKHIPCTFKHGDGNAVIEFDTISNPNNPNAAFKTLKPGSISLYNSETKTNVDGSDYNFDSAQFADLMDAIQTVGWKIHR